MWIDHNELYTRNMKCAGTPDDDTTFDGMLDIKNSATFITVSYNYMHDHAKVGLIGSSDTDSAERRVTYAHNRYENLGSRLPFQRFGYVHSYNNYFNNITGSGINPRMGGHILVENNFFENALNPMFSQSTILGPMGPAQQQRAQLRGQRTLQHHLDGLLRQHSVPEGDQLDDDRDLPDHAAVHLHHVRARGFEVHRAECRGLWQGSAGSGRTCWAPAAAAPTTSRR